MRYYIVYYVIIYFVVVVEKNETVPVSLKKHTHVAIRDSPVCVFFI